MKSYWVTVSIALTLAGPGVFAQDAATTQSPTTSQSTSNLATGMMGTTPDFSLLIDSPYCYTKLVQAKARGLSDAQIAAAARISRQTGVSFTEIVDDVLRGTTFFSIIEKYNLPLTDLMDIQDEETSIAAYKAAYEKTDGFVLNDYRSMAYNDAELDAMEARSQSLFAAIPPTASGTAMQFPVTAQPPAPIYPTPPYVARQPYNPPVPPAPVFISKPIVQRPVVVHKTVVHKTAVRRRRVYIQPKRRYIPRRRVRPVKRIIYGS